MTKVSFRSNCPISSSLDLMGDKWTLLIIRDLCFFGKKTFGELSESDEKIASNILSARLKNLVSDGIVSKSKMPDNKKVFVYSLTEKGIDLLPILAEYIIWGARYFEGHVADEARQFAKALLSDKAGIISEVKKKLTLSR